MGVRSVAVGWLGGALAATQRGADSVLGRECHGQATRPLMAAAVAHRLDRTPATAAPQITTPRAKFATERDGSFIGGM